MLVGIMDFVVSELHCLFSCAALNLTEKGISHWILTEHCAGLSMRRSMSGSAKRTQK